MQEANLLHARKYSIRDAVGMLGVGQTKLRALIRQGEIPTIRIGSTYFLLESDLEHYLAQHYGRNQQVGDTPTITSAIPAWVEHSDVLKKQKSHRAA